MIAPLVLVVLVILSATGIIPKTPAMIDIYNILVFILLIISVIEYMRRK